MTHQELKTRVKQLPEIPNSRFIHEACTLWNAILPMFISKRHRHISEHGTFIYWSPHEPVTQADIERAALRRGKLQ